MRHSREADDESSSLLRTLVNSGMKPINVWPMAIMLICIVLLVIWLRPH
jgi:hypothetical protein